MAIKTRLVDKKMQMDPEELEKTIAEIEAKKNDKLRKEREIDYFVKIGQITLLFGVISTIVIASLYLFDADYNLLFLMPIYRSD